MSFSSQPFQKQVLVKELIAILEENYRKDDCGLLITLMKKLCKMEDEQQIKEGMRYVAALISSRFDTPLRELK